MQRIELSIFLKKLFLNDHTDIDCNLYKDKPKAINIIGKPRTEFMKSAFL